MTNPTNINQEKENVFSGVIGSFLFALVGGILWFVLYQVGFLAGISGAIGVVCAIKGYAFFAKKESLKGVIISVLMAAFVIVIAWYFCLATDVYNAYQEWYAAGEVDFTVTFAEAVTGAHVFLSEPEIGAAYFKDLAIGLGLCVIAAFGVVSSEMKKVKAKKEAEAAPQEVAPEASQAGDVPAEPAVAKTESAPAEPAKETTEEKAE